MLMMNDNKYFPKNCLKFKLSFLKNALKNFLETYIA